MTPCKLKKCRTYDVLDNFVILPSNCSYTIANRFRDLKPPFTYTDLENRPTGTGDMFCFLYPGGGHLGFVQDGHQRSVNVLTSTFESSWSKVNI